MILFDRQTQTIPKKSCLLTYDMHCIFGHMRIRQGGNYCVCMTLLRVYDTMISSARIWEGRDNTKVVTHVLQAHTYIMNLRK